jgi:uncharacterized protein YggT (Ycf19 family)
MEERREVVERRGVPSGPGVVATDVVTREPAASVAAEQQRVARYDPYAERRGTTAKLVQLVWLVFGIVEALIAIRFVLRLLGANPNADFARLVDGVTAPLVAPFVGLFGTPQLGGSVFEPQALVALVVYLLLAWVLARLVWLLAGEARSAVTTSASTVERVD